MAVRLWFSGETGDPPVGAHVQAIDHQSGSNGHWFREGDLGLCGCDRVRRRHLVPGPREGCVQRRRQVADLRSRKWKERLHWISFATFVADGGYPRSRSVEKPNPNVSRVASDAILFQRTCRRQRATLSGNACCLNCR